MLPVFVPLHAPAASARANMHFATKPNSHLVWRRSSSCRAPFWSEISTQQLGPAHQNKNRQWTRKKIPKSTGENVPQEATNLPVGACEPVKNRQHFQILTHWNTSGPVPCCVCCTLATRGFMSIFLKETGTQQKKTDCYETKATGATLRWFWRANMNPKKKVILIKNEQKGTQPQYVDVKCNLMMENTKSSTKHSRKKKLQLVEGLIDNSIEIVV